MHAFIFSFIKLREKRKGILNDHAYPQYYRRHLYKALPF